MQGERRWSSEPGGQRSGGAGAGRRVSDLPTNERERVLGAALAGIRNAVIVTDARGTIRWVNEAFTRLSGYPAEEAVGRNPRLLRSGEQDDDFYAGLWSTVLEGRIWHGELVERHRQGHHYTVEMTVIPVRDDTGDIRHLVGIQEDVTELLSSRRQSQRRAAQQEAVARLGQDVLAMRGAERVLERACRVLADVLAVELALVLELTPDRSRLLLRAGVGWPEGTVGRTTVANHAHSQPGYTLLGDEAVVVRDFASEPRFTAPALLGDQGIRSGISVPIATRRGTFGVLGVHSRSPRAFSPDDAAFLTSVANLVGSALGRHAVEAELERLALFDPLTGLANRTLLIDRLTRAVDRAGPEGAGVAVVLVDLDGLRLINDALGRTAGDELLRAVAERLSGSLPEDATLARVGDDEFVVLLEGLTGPVGSWAEQALRHGDQAEAVASGHYRLRDAEEVYVTARVGVSVRTGDETPAQLLRDAQAATGHVSQPGPRVALYDREQGTRTHQHLELVNGLRRAVDQDELHLVYQPEVDLRTGTVFGCEALLRWHHPVRGILAPDRFLDAAEGAGLLGPLGEWVLERACTQAVDVGTRVADAPLTVAVNVSPSQLADPKFVDAVARCLDGSGLPPQRLFLEVTEGAMVRDRGRTLATLRSLRELGVAIALDDFGTGFSSLTHLHTFPIDVVKVDRAFVQAIHDDTGRTIVEATIGLAHTLGLLVVAEGVESPAQLTALRELGCDIAQGYHWARPLPPDQLAAWLRRWDR